MRSILRRDPLLEEKRDEHRLEMAHRLIQIRVFASSMWFAYEVVFGVYGSHADHRATAPLTGAYAVLSLALLLASRHYPAIVRRSWLSLPFFDLPLIFVVQYIGTPLAQTPVGNAAFSIGLLAILIVVAQLSMRIRNVLVTAAVAIVLEVLLLARAGLGPYSWWAAFIVLSTIGISAAAVVDKFSVLLRDAMAERTRISREIHDTLAQGLAGISMQLENVDDTLESSPAVARHHLDRARQLARHSLADARQALAALRSEPAPTSNLPSGITNAARNLSVDTNANIQVNVVGTPRPLPATVEASLLRVVQEALTNAAKHAGAKRIDVEVRFESSRVLLSVRDDGRGFLPATDPLAAAQRFGVIGMKERIAEIGGAFDIRTGAGTGTVVQIAI